LFSGAASPPEITSVTPSLQDERQATGIGPITFAENVTDDSNLLNPSRAFTADTTTVYAYFEYWDLTDGQP
jgi:hypothetical protein